MSKFFDFGEPLTSDDVDSDDSQSTWFHINARDMNLNVPDGMVISFWLWGVSEIDIRSKLDKKNIKDIEWIKKETPPFA
jgi:hypothetical protein|tara:strand:- start:78 stop:314 length:237 start_codon:yes stop_codon:yes gene_type:complete